MSLKAFHVFFVAVSILMALGVGWWGLTRAQPILGAGSLICAAVLVVYGLWFRRSKKELSYL